MRLGTGVLLLGAQGVFLGATMAQETQRVTVVFVDRTINVGTEPIPLVNLWLACAPDTPTQTVHDHAMLPEPNAIETDPWGQRIARWTATDLGPGEHLVARTVTEATLHPWTAPLSSATAGGDGEIPPEIADLYLCDGEKYALDSETIRGAVAEIAADPTDPVATVGRIFDYVVDHLKYSRDGTWDPADVVLERGTGSCSEYTFLFIALCRACGIPARFVGGNALRSGADVHIDRVSHRWAEAYLPGVGWAPFDPTRSDGEGRYRRFFGVAPDNVLTLVQGDGGKQSPLDWRYESYHVWDADNAQVKVHRRGWWLPPLTDEVRAQVAPMAEIIPHVRDPETKRGLICKARSVGHPFVLPWLDDFLYDPDVRLEAAQAMQEIGGPATVVAVIDSMGRTEDIQGDEEIAAFLNDWTGEAFSAARSDWQSWLGTRAFRDFSAPGKAALER